MVDVEKAKKERLKEEEPKEEAEKAHAEPDQDNSGGASDNDDDNKAKKKFEEVDEDDDEEEKKKKKKAKKGEGHAVSPEESGAASDSAEHSTSPGMGVPSTQNVFTPPSSVSGKREQETPMGKSVEPDLTKSPLFVNISKQMESLQEALSTKVDALEKSVNDRLGNIKKDMEKVEKFYEQSFYKAAGENVGPEALQSLSIAKQIENGTVRFRNK
jgi:hypothetical protein